MAQVTITAQNEWVDLNTTLSIPLGTNLTLTNIGVNWGVVIESSTKPTNATKGYPISNMTRDYAIMDLSPEPTETVWIKNCTLDVQEA